MTKHPSHPHSEKIRSEAAASTVRHTGPAPERWESALERYLSAMAGDDLTAPAAPATPFPAHHVGDVMTKAVVTAHEDAQFKEIARALERNRISGVPVVDAEHHIVGMVTASDLLARVIGDLHAGPRGHRIGGRAESRRKREGLSARELMTSPAITTTAHTKIVDAARLAAQTRVRSLPVVDADATLIGIVTRGDLIRLFLRDDIEIRHAIERDVVRTATVPGRQSVRVSVEEGVVTLTGEVETALTARRIAYEAHQVVGVVDVRDELDFTLADNLFPLPS